MSRQGHVVDVSDVKGQNKSSPLFALNFKFCTMALAIIGERDEPIKVSKVYL